MKKWIYLLLFAIIGLVCYSLFYNAKSHVKAVEVADELIVKTDSLDNTVKTLNKEKESALKQIGILDSTLEIKEQVIDQQKTNLTTLKRNMSELKRQEPIIIRDTVYITETKNFWGRKKKTVETKTSTDSSGLEFSEPDSLEIGPDTLQ